MEKVKIVKPTAVEDGKYVYDVRFKGGIWTAVSDMKLNEGDIADISRFEGNKIIIEKK